MEFLENEKNEYDEYKSLLSTNEIQLWIKPGSRLKADSPLIKARYIFKTEINPKIFLKLMYEERKAWDDGLVNYIEVEKISNNISIIYYIVKPIIYFMRGKDYIEKSIRFKANDTYYEYNSSINHKGYPSTDKYQRCETIFGGSILVKELDSYVYYTFSQVNVILLFSIV